MDKGSYEEASCQLLMQGRFGGNAGELTEPGREAALLTLPRRLLSCVICAVVLLLSLVAVAYAHCRATEVELCRR